MTNCYKYSQDKATELLSPNLVLMCSLTHILNILLSLSQDEILQNVDPEAFELGLLMGTEPEPKEEESQVYCFQHRVFQEFIAGKFIATLDVVSIPLCAVHNGRIRKQIIHMGFSIRVFS